MAGEAGNALEAAGKGSGLAGRAARPAAGGGRDPTRNRFEALDLVILTILVLWAVAIVLPFLNVVAMSFSTQKEVAQTRLLLFPTRPTILNYVALVADGRIWIGYRTTLLFLGVGMPFNMVLTTGTAYALSRGRFPGKRFFLYAILFTMLFSGGIIPMYLLMRDLSLTNSFWSVILAYGVNTFYMIIMRNYFSTLPVSLIESAMLDGAGEWRILLRIIIPLSMPIIATITLFYSVDRWNEWFNAMIFIRNNNLIPLQLILRSIVIESRLAEATSAAVPRETRYSDGIKMAAVIVTMLPVMCVFPFLQKYFVKGIMIGAIKT